jgi:hypothetical protein
MSVARYAIFAGYNDTPCGGFKDIYDFAYTLDEAVCIFNKLGTNNLPSLYKNDGIRSVAAHGEYMSMGIPFDWVHIVDLNKKQIIVDSKNMIKSRL